MTDSHATQTRTVSTFCRICEPSCGFIAEVEGQQVTRLRPNKEHPATKGFACHKGLAFNDVHVDPDRVNVPLRRQRAESAVANSFESLDWESAIEQIGERLNGIRERYGDGAIAGFMGNPTAFNSLAQLEVPSFFRRLGGRFFSSLTQDCANKLAGSEAVFGSSNLHPVPDLAHTDYFLCLGENPKVSHMSFYSVAEPMALMRSIVSRGGKVRYVNPRRIEAVSPATGDWQPIRPDTDLYFLAALLNAIDSQGGFDEEVLARHGKRVAELRAFIADFSPDVVAPVCGIDADQIRQLASEWLSADAASVHMSTGVNMGRQGTLCYWLVQMLSFVTGNLGRRGGNIYPRGFYDSAPLGAKQRSEDISNWQDSEFGPLREVGGTLPGNLLPDFIEAGDTPIRALIVIAGNPLLSVGGEERMRESFKQLELIVVIDLYRTATAELADYVLPAVDWLERPDVNLTGVGMQAVPFVHYSDAVVPPLGERRPEWWILARLAKAMGQRSLFDSDPNRDITDVSAWESKAMAKIDALLAGAELSRDVLQQQPGGAALMPELEPEALLKSAVQFADGRVDCCPPLFDEALAAARQQLAEDTQAGGELRLINLRSNYMHNSWLHTMEKLKRPKQRDNPLHMSPADAQRLGLVDEQTVRVHNRHGEIEATVRIDDSLVSGAVAMSHGWGNAGAPGMRVASRYPGVNVNRLLPSGLGSFDKLSNQAFMSGVPVTVEALPQAQSAPVAAAAT